MLADVAEDTLKLPNVDWMTVMDGSLWAKQDSSGLKDEKTGVYRIDPTSGEVTDLIDTGKFERPLCQGLGSSKGAVWSCPAGGTDLVRIDTAENSVVATVEADKLADEGRMIAAAGKLWILTAGGVELTGIDLASNVPIETVALPADCIDLAGGEKAIWVMCDQDDQVVEVDPATAKITGQLGLPGARTASLSDQLWVGFEGGVAQVDPKSLDVLATYELYPQYGGAIFATPDDVWVREEDEHFLSRIDPAEKRITEIVSAPDLPSAGDVVVAGGKVWMTASDDETLVSISADD